MPIFSGLAWSSSVAGTVATNSIWSDVVVPSVFVAVMMAGPAFVALMSTVTLPATALMTLGMTVPRVVEKLTGKPLMGAPPDCQLTVTD